MIPELSSYHQTSGSVWVGVDRGTLYLLDQNIEPQFAFGDFDSVTDIEKRDILHSNIKINQYRSEKDSTDMEIAFEWSLTQNPEEILLFGASGGRLDHELMNIQLLYKSRFSSAIVKLIDIKNEISLHMPGSYRVDHDEKYRYISFLSHSEEVRGITLEGFKYPLKQAVLNAGSSLCISNELVNKSGTYSFDSGIILMVKSRD